MIFSKYYKKGIYILVYHNVDYKLSVINDNLDITIPPDEFYNHVKSLEKKFTLVSLSTALDLISENRINDRYLSFWFDDGYRGVLDYGAPILKSFGIESGLSVCSDFVLRKSIFWRHLENYLYNLGRKDTFLKALKLNKVYDKYINFKHDDKIISILNDSFNQTEKKIAKYEFDNLMLKSEELLKLKNNYKWKLFNHSKSHYNILSIDNSEKIWEQFVECKFELNAILNNDYWVFPFNKNGMELSDVDKKIPKLVYVGNRANNDKTMSRGIFRFYVPEIKANKLPNYILRNS